MLKINPFCFFWPFCGQSTPTKQIHLLHLYQVVLSNFNLLQQNAANLYRQNKYNCYSIFNLAREVLS